MFGPRPSCGATRKNGQPCGWSSGGQSDLPMEHYGTAVAPPVGRWGACRHIYVFVEVCYPNLHRMIHISPQWQGLRPLGK